MKLRRIIQSLLTSIALTTALLSANAANYAEHSVLSQGSWKKISVKESGVCKLTYDQLKGMGFSHPEQVRVYGYGGAQLSEAFNLPKTDDLNETPIYDNGSALFFYAQGPRSWNYRGLEKDHPFDITSNLYSTLGYYFLTEKNGERNIVIMDDNLEAQEDEIEISNYMEHLVHKTETINPTHSGKGWLGDQTLSGKTFSTNFYVKEIDTTQSASVYLNLAAQSNRSSNCYVKLNDITRNISFTLTGGHTLASGTHDIIRFKPNEENHKLTISYSSQSEADKLWVEQIVFCAYKKLKMDNVAIYFRNPNASEPNLYKYRVEGANNSTIVWNITNPLETKQVPTAMENGLLTFRRSPNGLEEFVAFNPSANNFVKADLVGDVNNQDLHACKGYDAIIITHPDFKTEAERLAQLHEEHDGIYSLIVTPNEIYNEFSSGTPDASAIRWFLKMFYDRGELEKSVILIGDGSFDNRGVMNNSSNNNHIITYQNGDLYDESKSYVTDDYFCFLSDSNNNLSNGRMKMNYSIGRLPVSNLQQATNMVNKVEKYLGNNQFGKWKNKVCLIADDNDGDTLASTVNKFFGYSDNIGKIIHTRNPAMEIQKIHIDAYTRVTGSNGYRYPEAEDAIRKSVEDGAMIVNYIGHSSELAWSAERIFTQSEAANIYNDKQGFWFTASCQFALFDNISTSGGEDLVMNPNGGAITLFSAARTVYDDKNDNLNRNYAANLFERDENGEALTIGEVCRRSKITLSNDSNKLSYMLLGDPLLKLKYPEGNVVTDSITILGKGVTDTINALSEVKIFGHITNKQGQFMDNFNGIVHITVYDKESKMFTKGNPFDDEDQKTRNRHAYYDRLNVLFSGKAEVHDGEFSTVMKITKDINYNYGTGRIYYYAYDEDLQFDADGANESLIIGGSSDSEITDSCGPTIRLYMNHNGFLSGDKVNTTPVLIAEINDENGINASGSGIGHDIILTTQGGQNSTTVLNSYFSYDIDSYSNGTVTYQFPELAPGHYTIQLKAWDLLNNSSEKSLDFIVDEKEPIRIHNIDIYPSMASEEATIKISHDRPQSVSSYRIRIYNIMGVEVYSSELYNERIEKDLKWIWDLNDNKGKRVDSGIYLIRAEFETEEDGIIGLAKKMMVK